MLSRSFTLLCLTALVGTAVAADTTVTTVILKETVTQAAPTATATQEQNNTPPPPPPNSHPFPQAFPGQGFMPPPGFQPPLLSMGPPPPAVQPGSIVSPFAAVLCVLTVAGCYWAFKFLPNMQPVSHSFPFSQCGILLIRRHREPLPPPPPQGLRQRTEKRKRQKLGMCWLATTCYERADRP